MFRQEIFHTRFRFNDSGGGDSGGSGWKGRARLDSGGGREGCKVGRQAGRREGERAQDVS